MRILVINLEYPPLGGGGANATQYLAKELVRRGHKIDVITSAFRGLPREEVDNGAHIIRIPVRRERMDFCTVKEMLTFAVSAVPYSLTLASRNSYDLTHVFFTVPCGHIGWLLKRTHGLPYIISTRGGDVPGFKPHGYHNHYRRVKPIVKYLWHDADATVAVSQGLRDQMYHVDGTLRDVLYIPNGVDTKEFYPVERKTTRQVRILCVTRLIRRKGIDFLFDAVALIKERISTPFHIDLVGDGVYRKQLERRTQELGIQNLVTFHGAKKHDQLLDFYQKADIFCLPSLAEGMANVLLEALASGLPIVTTNVGGSLELVRPGVNGFLVHKEDATQLAERLIQLIASEDLRKSFGEASYQHAREFAWESVASQYETIYERIKK